MYLHVTEAGVLRKPRHRSRGSSQAASMPRRPVPAAKVLYHHPDGWFSDNGAMEVVLAPSTASGYKGVHVVKPSYYQARRTVHGQLETVWCCDSAQECAFILAALKAGMTDEELEGCRASRASNMEALKKLEATNARCRAAEARAEQLREELASLKECLANRGKGRCLMKALDADRKRPRVS